MSLRDRSCALAVAILATRCHDAAPGNGTRDLSVSGGADLATGGGGGDGAGGGGGSFDLGWSAPDLGSVITPGDRGAVDVTLTIHADQMQRFISPFIYGVTTADR